MRGCGLSSLELAWSVGFDGIWEKNLFYFGRNWHLLVVKSKVKNWRLNLLSGSSVKEDSALGFVHAGRSPWRYDWLQFPLMRGIMAMPNTDVCEHSRPLIQYGKRAKQCISLRIWTLLRDREWVTWLTWVRGLLMFERSSLHRLWPHHFNLARREKQISTTSHCWPRSSLQVVASLSQVHVLAPTWKGPQWQQTSVYLLPPPTDIHFCWLSIKLLLGG